MDQKQFLEKAGASGKPTVVDFWAPWCMPCRMTKPVLEKLAKEYHDEVNFWPVNADEQQGLLQELKIYGIPTVLLVQDGKDRGEIYRRPTGRHLSPHVRSTGKRRDTPGFHLAYRPPAAPGSRHRYRHLRASNRDLVAAPAGTADPVHRRLRPLSHLEGDYWVFQKAQKFLKFPLFNTKITTEFSGCPELSGQPFSHKFLFFKNMLN